jgi:hypothetical protein
MVTLTLVLAVISMTWATLLDRTIRMQERRNVRRQYAIGQTIQRIVSERDEIRAELRARQAGEPYR